MEKLGLDIFQCGYCCLSFQKLGEFLYHKASHAAKSSPVECLLCGQSYNKSSCLLHHYKKKHNASIPRTEHPIEKANRKQVVNTVQHDVTGTIDSTVDPDNTTDVIVPTPESSGDLQTIHVVITKTADDSNMVEEFQNAETNCLAVDDVDGANSYKTEELSCQIVDQTAAIESDDHAVHDVVKDDLECSETEPVENKTIVAGSDQDFHFIFVNSLIKGKKFMYSKHGFKCLHCDFKTGWRNSLCKHMSDRHTGIMAIHKLIEIKSPQQDENHKVLRMSEYLSELRKSKHKKVKKVRGVETQDKPGTFTCSKCNKVFNRLRYLRKHLVTHKDDNKYLCDECGKAFKTKYYLSCHRRTHKTRVFKCLQCDFTSNVNSLIHAHRQIHSDGCVLCDVCGQAYLDNSTLKKHKQVHDMSRPFACSYPGCTWRFNKEVLCQAHYKSHTTVGDFVCSVCQYTFRQKHHLQRHLQSQHGIAHTKKRTKKDSSTIEINGEQNTVNFVIDSDKLVELQSAIEEGNLVISSTDVEGNTVNYVSYHPSLLDEETVTDAQTIVIPQSDHIIFQQ